MADRIYTQADYDKVTDMYNTYQNTKDRYTPEQQQRIESAFSNAWTSVSNWIEASKNRIADMYLDDNWNTVQVYWDWRSEIVQYAPVAPTNNRRYNNPNPKPNPNPNPNNSNGDLVYMWDDDTWNPIYIKRQNASSYLWWDFDKYWLIWPEDNQSSVWPTIYQEPTKSSWKQDYYSVYAQMKWTWTPATEISKRFRWWLWVANSHNASLVRNDLVKRWFTNQQINDFISDWSRATLQPQEQSKLNSPYRIQTTWNENSWIRWIDRARQNLLNRWYTIWENWVMYRPDWSPLL